MKRCSCAQGTSCHHISGECGCPPGFTGNGCEQSECFGTKSLSGHDKLSDERYTTGGLESTGLSNTLYMCLCTCYQLVFQEHLGRTVTRSVSAQRQTSSATRCLDYVTVLQVSLVPNVTKVCRQTYLNTNMNKFLKLILAYYKAFLNDVKLCLFSVCAEGLYGPNCERVCKCENGGKCTPSTGACQCPEGFIGARCNISESVLKCVDDGE